MSGIIMHYKWNWQCLERKVQDEVWVSRSHIIVSSKPFQTVCRFVRPSFLILLHNANTRRQCCNLTCNNVYIISSHLFFLFSPYQKIWGITNPSKSVPVWEQHSIILFTLTHIVQSLYLATQLLDHTQCV